MKFIILAIFMFSSTAFSESVQVKVEELLDSEITGPKSVLMTEIVESEVQGQLSAFSREKIVGACVAKHHDSGRTWSASGATSAISVATYFECAKWAVEKDKSPCDCYVTCSPFGTPTDFKDLIAKALSNLSDYLVKDSILLCD